MPAHQLIGQLLTGLRLTLESMGDWELVAALTDSALARGSSATRQRAARTRGGLQQVVDGLLTETRAGTGWLPRTGSAPTTNQRGIAWPRLAGDALLSGRGAHGPRPMSPPPAGQDPVSTA